ncbi:pyruvate kinase, partial [Ochromonadaceae sp. CCMP2298]
PHTQVHLAQKMMIRKCNLAGKPVVTATQMLESMITNPRPTRAEAADVANAILDGSDVVMLSGETANGEFAVEAVTMMANCCIEAESLIDYDTQYSFLRQKTLEKGNISATESIASSAVKTAREMGSSLIIVLTQSGTAARFVSKYRPTQPILCVTADAAVARQVQGYVVPSLGDVEAVAVQAVAFATAKGLCKAGDCVVLVQVNNYNTNKPITL